jgi:hypothetical protein
LSQINCVKLDKSLPFIVQITRKDNT